MRRRDGLLAALGWSAVMHSPLAAAQAPNLGDMKPLGQDRFQIGRIVVDKRAGSFIVPGRVHVVGKPLEYLATSPRGMKEYESMLELDASGSEFNLACILIGLERDPKQVPLTHFRTAPRLIGPRVGLSVAWTDNGKRRQVPAAEALLNPEAGVKPETVEWVYTGAPASDHHGRFVADETGTLIGFVQDANSIIEASSGIGLGAYGSVRGHALLPPVGTAIELIVEAVNSAK
ncbi:YdjY domain-containing protein [Ideonella sp. A 288]|uniref:YdjY domain-containing protein n=1 Tax=Ideonella sp. A 288 TaxID=1962181 RepID=UPI000B4A8C6D|nr:YdjY domain-containing protein [Ideonella sp. A 288]